MINASILKFFEESTNDIISNRDQPLGGYDFENELLDYYFSYLFDNYKINLKDKKIIKNIKKLEEVLNKIK